ncbi:MAG: DUF488 family protein [Patescibacteria group bacterium]
MVILVKRVYERPAASDGVRVLADRLWPRGVSKAKAHIDAWAKELAPSTTLRKWVHQNPDKRFGEFVRKYRVELAHKKSMARGILNAKRRLTLVTAVKNPERSHIPVLVSFLKGSVSKSKLTMCSRGHRFLKSSVIPVCPTCWPGRYKKRS